MEDTEETPSQRQARIRREKREAKIKGTAQERLEKITKLSGRTPEMMNDSPISTPPRTASPAIAPRVPPPAPMSTNDPEQMRAQEEYLRALLSNQVPQQQEAQSGLPDQEDPMMKMIASMMGGMNGDPNAEGMPSFNPDDLAKATGIPPFLMNMVMGKQSTPATPQQQKETRNWKLLHLLFAFVAGIYLLFTINTMTSTFGADPPAPATARNPFLLFMMGELLLHGSQTVLSSTPRKSGPGAWLQTMKDTGRDASVMVFMLGFYGWWLGTAK